MARTFLIYDRIAHHAARSGYDQLARHVDAKAYRNGPAMFLARRIGSRRLSRFPGHLTAWYSDDALRREIAICMRAATLPLNDVFHWLYAENDLRLAPLLQRRWNNRFVATFHQPGHFLDDHLDDQQIIRGLDAAVIMAETQRSYMEQFLPPERVFHVPHGVDTDYWAPSTDAPRAETPTFLFVGSWLRDIETLRATIRTCAEQDADVCFRLIVPPSRVGEFVSLPRTTVLTGISDEQLLHEYRTAHALLLPLLDATANNVVLEAMSCGTPVVSTHIGGTPEYVPESAGILTSPGKATEMVEAVRTIERDASRRDRMGEAARDRALTLDWQQIGAQQMQAYRAVAAMRREHREPPTPARTDDAPGDADNERADPTGRARSGHLAQPGDAGDADRTGPEGPRAARAPAGIKPSRSKPRCCDTVRGPCRNTIDDPQ